jgi:hypothetical protein
MGFGRSQAERIFYPDAPPLPADHDVQEAAAFTGVICSSPEAVAYLAFARTERRLFCGIISTSCSPWRKQ